MFVYVAVKETSVGMAGEVRIDHTVQCAAGCCSMLQYVAVCGSVVQKPIGIAGELRIDDTQLVASAYLAEALQVDDIECTNMVLGIHRS